jgi:non-ribosomal peptide synthetase component F
VRPSLLAAGRERRAVAGGEDYVGKRRRLGAAQTKALQALARERGLSLDTFVKGALALLLSCRLGTEDVVFGATSAGRPPALSGVESMVGLFINTLPLRVEIDDAAPLLSWLKRIQVDHAEVRDYEYAPLTRVQQWSELASGVPLFDVHQIFENYPVDDSLESAPVIPLSAHDFRSFTRANFPVSLVSAVLGDELSLKILHDTSLFDAVFVDRMLEELHATLVYTIHHREATVGDLRDVLVNMEEGFREADAHALDATRRKLLTKSKRRVVRIGTKEEKDG